MTSSIYNYMNNAKVWLPMTMEVHDSTNVRTLDKSGNGLHFRFGDGVTTNTFPTKISNQRGYSFDGVNDYLEALANQTNAITSGTWAVLYREKPPIGTEYIYSHWDAGGVRALLLHTASNLQFFCGDAVNNSFVTTVPLQGQVSFFVGYRTTDGFRRTYYNGLLGTPINTGVSLPSTTVAVNPRIGNGPAGGQSSCDVLWYGHWEYALTELQIRDLEARLKRQINDV